jgi:hypothetical protein
MGNRFADQHNETGRLGNEKAFPVNFRAGPPAVFLK